MVLVVLAVLRVRMVLTADDVEGADGVDSRWCRLRMVLRVLTML